MWDWWWDWDDTDDNDKLKLIDALKTSLYLQLYRRWHFINGLTINRVKCITVKPYSKNTRYNKQKTKKKNLHSKTWNALNQLSLASFDLVNRVTFIYTRYVCISVLILATVYSFMIFFYFNERLIYINGDWTVHTSAS